MRVLTNTSVSTFQECRRKFYLRYILGLRPIDEPLYFRFGRAYHYAHEVLAKTGDAEAAEAAICEVIDPSVAHQSDLAFQIGVERAKCLELFRGWQSRWKAESLEVLATEERFEMPIFNPETGYRSRSHQRAGVCDRLVKLSDGRVALVEFKTARANLEPDSDYWKLLRIDAQISGYYLAYQDKGVEVSTCLYDVVRKPEISPRQIPELDLQGRKIVLNAAGDRVMNRDGVTYRQSGGKGYTVVSKIESVDEYATRLKDDIAARPDFYFARREIPRLYSDINEYQADLWQMHRAIQSCIRFREWPRNPRACHLMGTCQFWDLCANGIKPSKGDTPENFKLGPLHPELERK